MFGEANAIVLFTLVNESTTQQSPLRFAQRMIFTIIHDHSNVADLPHKQTVIRFYSVRSVVDVQSNGSSHLVRTENYNSANAPKVQIKRRLCNTYAAYGGKRVQGLKDGKGMLCQLFT